MANRYWVGGTSDWDGTAGTKWAATSGGAGGASVPTTADDVFFDANSGANTVTIAAGNTGCKSMTCTGFTGTLTGTSALTIAGGFTLVAGMTCTATGTWSISNSGTLTSGGKTLPPLSIFGTVGMIVNQGDNFTFTSTPSSNAPCISVGMGTYNTNNYNITFNGTTNTGGGLNLDLSSNARTVNLGSSTIDITNSGIQNINLFIGGTAANLTLNAGTSTIKCTANAGFSSATVGFIASNLTFYNVELTNNVVGTSNLPFTGANTFNNLTLRRTIAGSNGFAFSANQTINGTLTVSGGTEASMRFFASSSTIGTTRTFTCAAVSLTDADFRDITIAGAAAPASGTRLGDCKGNSGITFPAAKTVYWNLAGAQNFSAIAWATSNTGTPAAANFPLAQDTAVFDNTGSVTGTITVDNQYNLGTLDMSARTSAMTLANSQITNIYGNYLNGTGTTLSGTGIWQFAGRGSQQITGNGRTFTQSLWFNSPNGTITLQDAVTTNRGASGAVQLINGTLDLNGKTLSIAGGTNATFLTSAGTKNLTFNGGTLTCNGTNNPFNNAAPTGFTTTAGTGTGTISLTGATAKTFVGGGSTFNCTINQGGAGALTITGANTFSNITNTYSTTGATTITFSADQTFTTWSAVGASGSLLTINSNTAGTSRTLTITNRTTGIDYLDIRDITANLAPVTFYAGANSRLGNNVLGVSARTPVSGEFIYVLASGTSWTVPSNWDSANNEIHLFAGGGSGAGAAINTGTNQKSSGGGGGGGGYTKVTNLTLTPGASVSYAIGSGGAQPATFDGNGNAGGNTTFNSGAYTTTGGGGGQVTITSSTGGTAGTGSTNNGGAGGVGAQTSTDWTAQGVGGGGGGGAGGPNGVGKTGGNGNGGTGAFASPVNYSSGGGGGNGGGSNGANASGATPGDGGNNSAGVGGGTSSVPNGFNGGGGRGTALGGSGADISNAGMGGGGGSGGTTFSGATPLRGGIFGGGGGAAGININAGGFGGAGGQGGIVIWYKATAAASATGNMFMMFR